MNPMLNDVVLKHLQTGCLHLKYSAGILVANNTMIVDLFIVCVRVLGLMQEANILNVGTMAWSLYNDSMLTRGLTWEGTALRVLSFPCSTMSRCGGSHAGDTPPCSSRGCKGECPFSGRPVYWNTSHPACVLPTIRLLPPPPFFHEHYIDLLKLRVFLISQLFSHVNCTWNLFS